jgi:hypothetical protein
MEKIIKYYQENKEQFWKDCLLSNEEDRQYLYNDWIEDYFNFFKKGQMFSPNININIK